MLRRIAHRDDIRLVEYGSGSNVLSRWTCPQDHEWWAKAADVFARNTGCAVCAGLAPKSETEIRQALARRDDVVLVSYSGHSKNHSTWRCARCRHTWDASVNNVLGKGSGCPVCHHGGLDLASPARVYLIYNLDQHAAKVGVTTAAHDTRLETFRRHGWQTYSIKHYATGAEAFAEEQRILADWRARGFPEAATEADMPMGGWTETAPLSALPGWEVLLDTDPLL